MKHYGFRTFEPNIYLYNQLMLETSRSSVRVVVEIELWPPKSVGRSGEALLLLDHGLAAARGAGNESRVITPSILTVIRLISLTVALAAGSARATGLDASIYTWACWRNCSRYTYVQYIYIYISDIYEQKTLYNIAIQNSNFAWALMTSRRLFNIAGSKTETFNN